MEHPIGELEDWKTVDPASGSTLIPGQVATYTLHFENTGTAAVPVDRDDVLTDVLDDATVTGAPVSSDAALTVSEIVDGRFTITGSLEPGQIVTVTYSVTVKADGERGDDRLANFLVPGGEEPPTECVPVDGERADCTVNHVSDVSVLKSSDPVSGSAVEPGQVVTYTLTFTNRSANPDAAGAVIDWTDHLVDVLDDATLTGLPGASDAGLTALVDGDTILITGNIPTGAVWTVTYSVTVKAWAEQGDHLLANVVAPTGETPVCVPDSGLCTEHPVTPPPSVIPTTSSAPPTTAPPTTPRPTPPFVAPPLAHTGVGSTTLTMAVVALLTLVLGGAMVIGSRRTRGQH